MEKIISEHNKIRITFKAKRSDDDEIAQFSSKLTVSFSGVG